MITPKRITEHALSRITVRKEYRDQQVSDIVYDLIDTYLDGVEVHILSADQLPNPFVTCAFPWIPLRRALEDVCRIAECVVEVSDRGVLIIRSETVEEKLRRATFIEAVLHKVHQKES